MPNKNKSLPNRTHEKEDCEQCMQFAREEGKNEQANIMFDKMEDLFIKHIGPYKAMQVKIEKHDKWIMWLTYSDFAKWIALILIYIKLMLLIKH
jgi:hypothetical protein